MSETRLTAVALLTSTTLALSGEKAPPSELEEQHQLSFWDALIVTAARKGGASRVLTEDLSPAPALGRQPQPR